MLTTRTLHFAQNRRSVYSCIYRDPPAVQLQTEANTMVHWLGMRNAITLVTLCVLVAGALAAEDAPTWPEQYEVRVSPARTLRVLAADTSY